MAGLDPEEDDSGATVAPSTQAVDASATPVHDAWKAWSSNPANNAALLQFGISMLQPRSPGQSAIGQFANSIGEGAQASGRVTTQADADELAQNVQTEREAKGAALATHGQAELINANAYKKGIDNAILNPRGSGMNAIVRAQNTFRSWAAKASDPLAAQIDPTGASAPPFVRAIRQAHPEIKDNSEIASNPRYAAEAVRLLAAQEKAIDPTGEGTEPSSTPAFGASAVSGGTPSFRPKVAKDANGKVWTEASPGVYKDSAGNVYSPQ